MRNSVLVLICCFLLSSCFDTSDGRLKVVNKSNRSIVFAYADIYSDNNILGELPPYSVDMQNNPLFTGTEGKDEYTSFILPHAEKRMWKNGSWDDVFLDESFKNNRKTAIFVLDAEIVKKYSWKEIRRKSLILSRVHYSRQDLEKQQWQIVYSDSKK
jgi:hypothetical protein